MSVRRTVIVLVIAAAGVGSAWYVHQRDGRAGTSINADRAVVDRSRLPIDEVDAIRLERADGTVVAYERQGVADWMQTEPLRHRVDAYSIRQLMVQAIELRATDVIPAEASDASLSPAALDLDPPRARVTFRWPAGEIALNCGRRGLAGRAYVQVEGDDTVYVVGQAFHQRAVIDDPKEWRDRRIFQNISADVQRITMRNGDSVTQIERTRTSWKLTQPLTIAADPLACDDLLQGLGKAQSQGFLVDAPADLEAFGLDEPVATVEVETVRLAGSHGSVERIPETQSMLIGPPIGGSQDRFAMIKGGQAIFRVTPQVLAALLRTPQQLADPTATTVQAPDVKRVMIRIAGTELQLERDLDLWKAPGFGDTSVSPALVEELLSQITDVRAPEIQIKAYPQHLEVATITLHGFDSRPMTTVRVAKDPETAKWALENGDNVLRVFPPSMVIHLTPEEFGLR